MNKLEKNAGIIAGISLIVMAIAAGFSYGYVHSLILGESPELTLQNLTENRGLFIAGLIAWIVIFITDLIVAIALYYFFRKASKRISQITALVRIIYTIVLGMAIIQLILIIPKISLEGSALKIASLFENFETIWSIGLIVFGIHLLGLGFLLIKSKFAPRFLGYLFYFAGLSYSFIHAVRQLDLINIESIAKIESILALPMALSEIILAICLIYIGFRKDKREQRSKRAESVVHEK